MQKIPKGYQGYSTLNPLQQQIMQGGAQLSPNYFSYLQELLDPSGQAADRFAAPYMRQFEEQTIPRLAEQFAGVGGLSSSGFQQSLGQAGAGLAENLAALRENVRLQGSQGLQALLQNILGQQTQALVPKQMSFGKQFALGMAPGVGQSLGKLLNPLSWFGG